jgi:peptidyl-prolyl cis-trans isomerase A (cyclophilin A)
MDEYVKVCRDAAENWQAELEFRRKDSQKQNPRVKVQTDQGDFVIELFEDDAPNTVANFVALVRDGFYSGRLIYRREPGWLIQGGGRDDSLSGDSEDWTIANEANQRRHWRGTIAMARTMDKDSGNTHFFITTGNRPMALELSTDWVVFGRITEGLEVAQRLQVGDRIQKTEAENLRDHDYQPVRLPAKKD